MPLKSENGKKEIPNGLWTKCPQCEQIIYNKELETNFKICPRCEYYLKLSYKEWIAILLEPSSFKELDSKIEPKDHLNFVDSQPYSKRIKDHQKRSSIKEALISGEGKLNKHKIVLCMLDFSFIGGSMGTVVGEKVTRAIEYAIDKKIPVITITASGGARMQEGILSLMQMAKTSAALAKLRQSKLPYISILSNPTTGGVTASFATLGDVIIAEPRALVGFAGPRVIEQTIRQKLPQGFQQSEFLMSHGLVDLIVSRPEIKSTLDKMLTFFNPTKSAKNGSK